MAFAVVPDAKIGVELPGQEMVDVGEDTLVFILHVLAHLAHVFVVEFENEKCHFVLSRAVDGFKEFATDVLKLEVEEKLVCRLEVVHHRDHIDFVDVEWGDGTTLFHDIGHSDESRGVDTRCGAHFAHGFVAHTELNAEAANHLQERGLGGNDIADFVLFAIAGNHSSYCCLGAQPMAEGVIAPLYALFFGTKLQHIF